MKTIWKENKLSRAEGKEQGSSLWVQEEYRYPSLSDKENRKPARKELQDEISVDIAVIGAGMAGILTAYLLQEQGLSVAVLELREAGSGMTKNTSAKITSQHGLIYHKLIADKGEEYARKYGEANEQAVRMYQELVDRLKIECDFERRPNYIYSRKNEESIRQEVKAAKKLGLPAQYIAETSLPFPVRAAVRFENQAQFHPLRFLDGVAEKLTVYEHTGVTELYDNGVLVTERGRVNAKSVIIATHYPFINIPGFYFLKLHQERSYLSAVGHCDSLKYGRLDGMYLDAEPQGFSLRNYKDYLIFGCGNHRTGKYKPEDEYTRLRRELRHWYPEGGIQYIWSNQDCMTPDAVPYIGKYSARTPKFYVAAGFNQWGMTGSMVSAILIRDLIIGKKNRYQMVFHPRRLMLSGSTKLLKDAGVNTIGLLSEYMKLPHDKLKDIGIGKAGVINQDGQRIGVYRESEEKYYFISTKCPHLGCSLEWNQNELTWGLSLSWLPI